MEKVQALARGLLEAAHESMDTRLKARVQPFSADVQCEIVLRRGRSRRWSATGGTGDALGVN